MKKLILTAVLAIFPATALAGGAGAPPVGPVSTAQVTNNTNVLFMEVATMSNLTEIRTSQLALQKSTNPQIRAFAQDMITMHTQAQQELRALAVSKGIVLADQPGADQRLQFNKLNTLSGAAFDMMYKVIQVNGHQMTLDLVKTYRTFGTDAQALAYAAKLEPIVTAHLAAAKALPDD